MTEKTALGRCLKLFWTFFIIGLCTFGGGFAMIPLIEREVVQRYKWITSEEFIDMIAVTQAAPGTIAGNSAVFVGYRLAGISGAAGSLLGVTMPSFLIILILAVFLTQQGEHEMLQKFFAGVRPAVVALILGAGLKMGKKSIKASTDIIIGAAALLLLIFSGIHPIVLIIAGAAAGLSIQRFSARKQKEAG
ncbi:MAG: chromate transporter [Clostridia bacterium]|jgi:chromate transporter|nr:chromate transporter [Clostridia bacterium]